jgi:predicted MFS family arabinose efflux permease
MLLGLAVFTLGSGSAALWPSYWTYFAALVLTSLGNYIFLPAMQAYLSDRVPYARRGLVMALTETSWSLAFIVGVPLIGVLISVAGWGSPFSVLAVLGLAAFIALALTLPATPPAQDQHVDIWHTLRLVLVHRPALAILLTSFAITAANECVNLVFGVWIEQAFNLQLASLAAASAVIGLSELSGEGLSGALVDRLGKERSLGIGIGLTTLAALALPYLGRSLEGALVGLFFFYLTFEFTIVCELPLVSEVLPEARATLMAANVTAFSLGRAAGSLLAPGLFVLGIQANTLAALGLNLLALGALRFVRIKSHS